MPIERLDHVQLAMPAGQEQAAREFYSELLGVPEVKKPAHLASRGGCWFEDGEVKIHLGVDPEFLPAKKAHPALIVSGLAALAQQLVDAGYRVTQDEPLTEFDRRYVEDPFGNRIELMERSTD